MKKHENKQALIAVNWHFICRHPAYFLAFGLGSGLSSKAPGTMGSLLAIPLYGLLSIFIPVLWLLVLTIGMFFVGIWVSNKTSQALGVHDYPGIVIDEIVAMWLVLIFAPKTALGIIVSFALFRFFDIVKPLPIRWFDQKVSNGLGIMLDDVIAGLMAIVTSYLINSFFLI